MGKGIRLDKVVNIFFKDKFDFKIKEIGSGLIHRTFFLQHAKGNFILQKINNHVFSNPFDLMKNIELISEYLIEKKYPKSILEIQKSNNGVGLAQLYRNDDNEYWRMFKYIPNAPLEENSIDEKLAYEVGKTFGEFHFYLKDFIQEKIRPTIPDFHNTNFYLKKLKNAIQEDPFQRVKFAKEEIDFALKESLIISKFSMLQLPKRVIHADPKINNLLFDERGEVVAIIDWDTIMVGNLLWDFGDLVRTTCCSQNEESLNFSEIKIQPDLYTHLKDGFLNSTQSFIAKEEKENLAVGAKLIIYEQAIRFLTDYLEGNKYYQVKSENHNLNRSKNQIALYQSFIY